MVPRGFECFHQPDPGIDGAIDALGPFLRRVEQAKLDRIHLEFLSDFINDGLHREGDMG